MTCNGFDGERCAAISRMIVGTGVLAIAVLLAAVVCMLQPAYRNWKAVADQQQIRTELSAKYVAAGDASFAARDFQAAQTSYIMAASINPMDSLLSSMVARARIATFASNPALLDKADLQQARAECAIVLDRFPTDMSNVKIVQGMISFRENRVNEALALLEEAAAADPASAAVHVARAMLWTFEPTRVESVPAEWEAAVAAAPEDPMILGMAGQSLINSQETFEKGLDMLRKAVVTVRNLSWLKTIGSALVQSGKADEAVDYINQAYTLSPRDPEALALIGQIHIAKREWEKAIPPLRDSMSIRETRDVMLPLAMALNSTGRFDQALPILQKLNQQGSDMMSVYEYANALAGVGRKEEAVNLYNAILGLSEQGLEGMQAQAVATLKENARMAVGRLTAAAPR